MTWRFSLALLFQTLLILIVPIQAIHTRLSGQNAILQTIPVDPYDLVRGYYQTLRYEISRVETLQTLPGWPELLTPQPNGSKSLSIGTRFFVILQAPAAPQRDERPPPPWLPVAVSPDLPENLSRDRVALEGTYTEEGFVTYDLERYYLPEDQRTEINGRIQDLQSQPGQERAFVVEVKIDRDGEAVPVRLWIGSRSYQF